MIQKMSQSPWFFQAHSMSSHYSMSPNGTSLRVCLSSDRPYDDSSTNCVITGVAQWTSLEAIEMEVLLPSMAVLDLLHPELWSHPIFLHLISSLVQESEPHFASALPFLSLILQALLEPWDQDLDLASESRYHALSMCYCVIWTLDLCSPVFRHVALWQLPSTWAGGPLTKVAQPSREES